MSRDLAGENPVRVAVSHQRGIERCRFDGDISKLG